MKKIVTECLNLFFIINVFLISPVCAENQKIIGLSHHWMGNEYNMNGNKLITEAFTKLGYKVFTLNANGDTEKQVSHVKTFIDKKVNGIIIFGGHGDAFKAVSMTAYEANIPLICHMMYLRGALTNIDHDNWEGSEKMAVWLANQMHGYGKYILLDLPDWHILQNRTDSIESVLKWFPNITRARDPYMVSLADPMGDAYSFTKKAIEEVPDLKGILCTWGMPLAGAIKAVIEMNKSEQIAVAGTDADKPVLSLMAQKNAPRAAVVGHPQNLSAEAAVRNLTEAMRYKTVKEAREHLPVIEAVDIAFISNTDPKEEFKARQVFTPDEAWEFFHKGSPKPWQQ